MSLDVHLFGTQKTGSGIFIRESGRMREITREEWDAKFPDREPVMTSPSEGFSANITHNLGKMASEADIYGVIWRPEENNIQHADDLIQPLRNGLERLKSNPDYYKTFNAENGWGKYEDLIGFVEEYLEACEQNPTATVYAYR